MATATAATFPLLLSPKLHLRLSFLSPNPIPSLYTHRSPLSHRTITHCKCRRRDEEREFGRRRRWKRRWWEDTPPPEMGGGVLEEVVQSLWIFKLFRFYKWWLPPILISMILATGPKAFLLALASMTGLSLLTLAFTKLWGLINSPNRRFKSKKKKKTRGRDTNNINLAEKEEYEEEEEEEEEEYRSWVSVEEDFSDFRGWDEIDEDKVFRERTTRREARGGRPRRERGDVMPLLLRLLIAVFPFLGSWTKML